MKNHRVPLQLSKVMSAKEDFVFQLSVLLLCLLFTQWIFVALLFIWLRKICQRADQVYNEWNVYSKLNLDLKPTGTETSTEAKNPYSIPLVIANRRAGTSETNKAQTLLNIDRTFAYTQADLYDQSLTRTPAAEGEAEDVALNSSSNKLAPKKQPLDSEDAPLEASGLKANNNDPVLLFLNGGVDDNARKGLFETLKGGQVKRGEYSLPGQKERIVLVEVTNAVQVHNEETLSSERDAGKPTNQLEEVKDSSSSEPATESTVLNDNTGSKNDADGSISWNSQHCEAKQKNQAGTSGEAKTKSEDEAGKHLSSEYKSKVKAKPRQKRLSTEKSKQAASLENPSDEGTQANLQASSQSPVVQETHHYGNENDYEFIGTNPANKDGGFQDTLEDIYESMDANISKVNPTSADPQGLCCATVKDPGSNAEELFDDFPVYSNMANDQQDSTMRSDDKSVFDSEEQGPTYVNIREMFDI
ncbi:PREDICTED: uncharacterized protein LOC107346851 isoform X3 [Acropora digitifera]|uniref:uncharacterized protein LOC107346851 isoform X3 n=1 Tax=Acropora digitifera TaxID=70779 RepID=UPI00077ACBA8|nr:PREDICTED: uncharacterized protein LOC107346851 isoform X3 [Acropora digitifera]